MIELDDVHFRFKEMRMRFNAVFPEGKITAVIGPSGAGKSTLLNLIAGFEQPASGRIRIAGRDVTDLAPAKRPVSILFQDHNVFPHLDVWRNVALGLSTNLRLDAEGKAKVDEVLAKTGLSALAKRKPGELSGGERQRVAIARTLLRDRPVLLLDEPFAALGPALRRELLEEIVRLKQDRHLTVILVSHQPEDARQAADMTAFLAHGEILALKATEELFADRDIPGLQSYLGGEATG